MLAILHSRKYNCWLERVLSHEMSIRSTKYFALLFVRSQPPPPPPVGAFVCVHTRARACIYIHKQKRQARERKNSEMNNKKYLQQRRRIPPSDKKSVCAQ
jgi:hypothetical protein